MGNRCLMIVHDGKKFGPVVYQHWADSPIETIKKIKGYMSDRKGDVDYATARLIGILHTAESAPSNLSLGCWNLPESLIPDLKEAVSAKIVSSKLQEYSHGDEGIYLIDCRDFTFMHIE